MGVPVHFAILWATIASNGSVSAGPKAMAAHLARLIYRMLKHGQAWVDRGAVEHEQRRQYREQLALERKASALGFRLVPAA